MPFQQPPFLPCCQCPGADVTYTFQIVNTGNVGLRNLQLGATRSSPSFGNQYWAVNCSTTLTSDQLEASDSWYCTARYRATQEDIELGAIMLRIFASFAQRGATRKSLAFDLPTLQTSPYAGVTLHINIAQACSSSAKRECTAWGQGKRALGDGKACLVVVRPV